MDGFLYDRTYGCLATRNSYLTSLKFLSELLSFVISIREFRPENWCVCVCVYVVFSRRFSSPELRLHKWHKHKPDWHLVYVLGCGILTVTIKRQQLTSFHEPVIRPAVILCPLTVTLVALHVFGAAYLYVPYNTFCLKHVNFLGSTMENNCVFFVT
jgi:hypothetical protein